MNQVLSAVALIWAGTYIEAFHQLWINLALLLVLDQAYSLSGGTSNSGFSSFFSIRSLRYSPYLEFSFLGVIAIMQLSKEPLMLIVFRARVVTGSLIFLFNMCEQKVLFWTFGLRCWIDTLWENEILWVLLCVLPWKRPLWDRDEQWGSSDLNSC